MSRHADFEPPLDVEAANLENQLLQLEIQVARGRLRLAEEEMARMRSRPVVAPVPEDSVVITKEHYESLREARSNLRWLLGRLGSGPVGWVARRKRGYRVLEERWLDRPQRGGR